MVLGDYVKVYILILKGVKDSLFRKGFRRNWSHAIFKVTFVSSKLKAASPYYNIMEEKMREILDWLFYRNEL